MPLLEPNVWTRARAGALMAVAVLVLPACSGGDDGSRQTPVSSPGERTTTGAPRAVGTILDVVAAQPDLGAVAEALRGHSLGERLADPGAEYTVFAPVDVAAAALDPAELDERLRHHVVEGRYLAADLEAGAELRTLAGSILVVNVGEDGRATVNGARLLTTDIEATNGVVHLVAAVFTAPGPAPTTPTASTTPTG